MRRKLKTIARKVHNFIERARMSESDYLTMKEQSNKFENMMSSCEFKLDEPEYTDVKDADGNILHRFKKSQSASLNINIDEMLKNGGILYDKERVKLNIEQKEENKYMNTKIISVFHACGKTYAFKKLNEKGYKILDSDSSQFSWCYDYNPVNSDKIEKYRNPEFPKNYIQHIKENIGKVDYIFVSSHKEVRDALIENGIYFTLVYPGRKMKAEWVGRCFLRGSGEKFCQLIADNWDKWIDEMEEVEGCDRYILGEDDSIDPDDLDRYYYLGELIEKGLI